MENMMEILIKARGKKIFLKNEFKELLMKISLADRDLKLDWDDYSSENWFIDVVDFKQKIPELYWHASEDAVNRNSFSLQDLYFATV